jgi:hypothetical protein
MGNYPGVNIIRVTPTILAAAYSAGETLFDAIEIPNAVSYRGGVSRIVGISMLSLHDAAVEDVGLVFMENQQNLGTAGAALGLSDSDAVAANIISGCVLNGSDNTQDLGDCGLYSTIAYTGNSAVSTFSPMLLQAAPGSTSVYVAGIATDGQDYVADGDIVLIFHIEYLG